MGQKTTPNQNQSTPESGSRRIFPFMRLKWPFIAVSLFFVSTSLFLMGTKGFNFGVDFRGGVKLVYQFSHPVGDGEIRGHLSEIGLGDLDVIQFGTQADNRYLIKSRLRERRNITEEVTQQLKAKMGGDKVMLISEENVGPKVGAELRKRGLFAVILTWILILIYIGIRFDFLFAPGAIVALMHDVIIPLGFFSLLGLEVNLPILAASLTIIGYSVNDTVVIFDRIRENLKKLPSSVPLSELIDRSLTETLSRTIVTSVTVFFVVTILFFFGGAVVHDFAFCMMLGVIFGTYSTLFIASPIYLALHRLFPHKGLIRSVAKR